MREGNWKIRGRTPDDEAWGWTRSPMDAPDKPEELLLGFNQGDVVSINGEVVDSGAGLWWI